MLSIFLKEAYKMARSARYANYLQVHFSQSEKEALRIEAFNRRTDMKTIVRQAVAEFLARQSAETSAGGSSVSLSADTHAQPQELPT